MHTGVIMKTALKNILKGVSLLKTPSFRIDTTYSKYISDNPSLVDSVAIKSDWYIIGNDIHKSIDNYSKASNVK